MRLKKITVMSAAAMLRIYLITPTSRCCASFVTMTTTRSKTFSFVRPNLTKQGTNCCTHSNSFEYTKEGISSFHHIRRQFSTSSSTLLYGGSKYNVGSGGGSTNNPKKSNEQNNNNEDDKAAADFEPTWTYTPYKPPPPKGKNRFKRGPGSTSNNGQQQRRNFSSRKNNDGDWIVPNKVTIPEDKIDMSFARSSGAGGQNVNKVSFHLNFVILSIFLTTKYSKNAKI